MTRLQKLYSVAFELTTACPCRCDTCGTDAGKRRPNELVLAEWLEQLDVVARLGAKRLTLLGGEPFLSPHWSALVRQGTELGLDVDVISCGIGISEHTLEEAVRVGLQWLTVSIDGTETAHDVSRGVPNGYREALETIRRFDTHGMKVGVTTQLNRRTLPLLDDLAPELQSAGAIGWQLQLTLPTGRARLHPERLLAPEDMPEVFAVIRGLVKRRGLRPYITDDLGYFTADDPVLRTPPMCPVRCWCGCFAGLRSLSISSIGDVKGCMSLPDDFIEGNVRTEPLQQIWTAPNRFAYNRAFHPDSLGEKCRTCDVSLLCRGGCTSTSVTTTGKPNQGPYCVRPQERT
ncbi:MAG: radical SAM protein [Polyangiaceae bacterium]